MNNLKLTRQRTTAKRRTENGERKTGKAGQKHERKSKICSKNNAKRITKYPKEVPARDSNSIAVLEVNNGQAAQTCKCSTVGHEEASISKFICKLR